LQNIATYLVEHTRAKIRPFSSNCSGPKNSDVDQDIEIRVKALFSARNTNKAQVRIYREITRDQECKTSLALHTVSDITPGIAAGATASADTGVSIAA
jgi:hypothetical protein